MFAEFNRPKVTLIHRYIHTGEANIMRISYFLTGHGCFRAYLYRFKIIESPLCPESDVTEDAGHVFFVWPRFQEARRTLWEVLDGRAMP